MNTIEMDIDFLRFKKHLKTMGSCMALNEDQFLRIYDLKAIATNGALEMMEYIQEWKKKSV